MENLEKLQLAAQINKNVVECSIIMTEQTKEAFKNMSIYIQSQVEKEPKMRASGINSLKNELLIFWNESINPDTEKFWNEIKSKGIDYVRKEPLRFALNKNRFRRVEQGIEANKHWPELKTLKLIKRNYSKEEIEKIEEIISNDEQSRFKILDKCLRKKQIPQSQYLKFGECMAYLSNCGLFKTYFEDEEVNELYDIWRNFQSK